MTDETQVEEAVEETTVEEVVEEATVSDAIEESRPEEEPEAADVPLTLEDRRLAAQRNMRNNMRAKAERLKG